MRAARFHRTVLRLLSALFLIGAFLLWMIGFGDTMAPQSWHPQVCGVQDCCFVEPLVKLSGRERDTFLRTVNIRSIPLIRPPPACLTLGVFETSTRAMPALRLMFIGRRVVSVRSPKAG